MEIQLKRVYDEASVKDGYRVLVDRLWPRGIKKENLNHDEWAKELAPSNELRKWFHSRSRNFNEFRKKYLSELNKAKDEAKALLQKVGKKKLTLLYASKNREENHAVVLKDFFEKLV